MRRNSSTRREERGEKTLESTVYQKTRKEARWWSLWKNPSEKNWISPPTTELHTEGAHRALVPKPPATGKLRSIMIKFHRYKTKEEILRKAWEKKEILLNNQRLFFDHDYPASVLNKQKEYNEVKQILKEKKIHFQTPYPARQRVFYEDST